MKNLILNRQALYVPVVNTRNNETLGKSPIAIFRKDNLKMEYLVVSVSEEESSQLLIRFEEIESINSYCVLVSLSDDMADAQAPLSRNDYIQLIGEDIYVKPDTINQIDEVVVDAETGLLILATAGETTLPAEQVLAIINLTESEDTESGLLKTTLDKQLYQLEARVETMSQQISAMMNSMLRMEELWRQKWGLCETETKNFSPHLTDASMIDNLSIMEEHPSSDEVVDSALLQHHMPLLSKIEQDIEPENEQSPSRTDSPSEQSLGLVMKQDEDQIILESQLLEKLDHIEQALEVLTSRGSLREKAIATQQEEDNTDIPYPKLKAETKSEDEHSLKHTEEEKKASGHTEVYSLRQPGVISGEEERIKGLRSDPLIKDFKMEGFDCPAGKKDPESVVSSESRKTADIHIKGRQGQPIRKKVNRTTRVFWKTSGSQLLGMGLFVAAYCALSFFHIL